MLQLAIFLINFFRDNDELHAQLRISRENCHKLHYDLEKVREEYRQKVTELEKTTAALDDKTKVCDKQEVSRFQSFCKLVLARLSITSVKEKISKK